MSSKLTLSLFNARLRRYAQMKARGVHVLTPTVIYWSAVLLILIGLASGCGRETSQAARRDSAEIIIEEQPTAVKTVLLKDTVFHQELIANGKVHAPQRADLRFRSDGVIRSVKVAEGQRVAAGTILAVLDDTGQQIALRQAELEHHRALLDYEDQLLRQGYRLADTASLDAGAKEIARLRSGLSAAVIALERATRDLRHTELAAPFAGTVANLKARPFNSASSFEYICTLVDDRTLLVEFKVLEQELPFIRNSRAVAVSPFSHGEGVHRGEVVSINPIIDDAGMVSVKARLVQPSGLMDGMGVQVVVRQALAGQLCVPKEAVLDRQGRKVVFTEEGGLAKWKYVEIAYENSTHYAIASGLKAGDEVIHSGNFNLAHDKPVMKTE